MTSGDIKRRETESSRVQAAPRRRLRGETAFAAGARRLLPAAVAAAAAVCGQAEPARAQDGALPPTPTAIRCASPGQDLVMPPEIVSANGVLRGAIVLTEENQRLPTATGGGSPTCAPQWVRIFRGKDADGNDLPAAPPADPPNPLHPDPIPGPTLRAQVGDLVQLAFINQVNLRNFDRDLDIDACTDVGEGGSLYPGEFDAYPNCLHASSTANIHYHGTHTNPDATGDNVYLQIRPLPRDIEGNLTTAPEAASVGFDEFFRRCAEQLADPLNTWPATWNDLPPEWTGLQEQLLRAYEQATPGQPLWTRDMEVIQAGGWPQYYIGAYPYCFALPAYTAETWPPPPGSTSPVMGQAPGTHWYHAHKHGSTAINVANGMTGAFIIEGEYDTYLDEQYGAYVLEGNRPWRARSQPVLVLNQLGTTPNLLTVLRARIGGGSTGPLDFVVNGRLRPKLHMQPGEVQLWRIVNSSGRSAAYFTVPEGLEWRQLAQDGVQFADENYQGSHNKPFYMAPANRVDLLVRAPMQAMTADVRVQNVMARSEVLPEPLTAAEAAPGQPLMTVEVSGNPVLLNGEPAQMPFLIEAAPQPPFLTDITDDELRRHGYRSKKLVFHSDTPQSEKQHTINGVQFEDGVAHVDVLLGAVEEWTVFNSTVFAAIDHPLHIHINPFQITEVFDPHERLVDAETGKLVTVLSNGRTETVPRYVTDRSLITDPRQCYLDPTNEATWSVVGACGRQPAQSNLVWWDTFAIPSARRVGNDVIPGYFKMRSRFVDYPGLYVLHCHILIHEDRGMMFSVAVLGKEPVLQRHH